MPKNTKLNNNKLDDYDTIRLELIVDIISCYVVACGK